VPRLCEFYPGICLTTEEKARKNLSQVKNILSHNTGYILYTYGSHKLQENSSRTDSMSVKDFFKDCCFSSPGRGGKFSPLWFRSNVHRARRWMGHKILSPCSVGIHLTVTSRACNWETLRLRKEGRRNLIASNC
jgi:hypothetical protein